MGKHEVRLFLLSFFILFIIQGTSFSENKSFKESIVNIKEENNNLHLVVTITMPSGKLETFGSEIEKMEIISHEDGEIDMIHLILGGNESGKTHVWYNYDLISKLSYKFLTERGREKIFVKILQPSPLNKELKTPINPLDPKEYR